MFFSMNFLMFLEILRSFECLCADLDRAYVSVKSGSKERGGREGG